MLPKLPGENIGSFVIGRTFYEEQGKGYAVVGPSSAGDGWSAYALYKDHIVRRDPWTIYEVNLQSGNVIAYEGNRMDCWFLAPMPDGCIYTFPSDPDSDPQNAYVARLNPARGAIELFGPGSPDSWNYSYGWGPDHALYVGGWKLHHAMRFDPVTGEFTDYGPQGPEATGGLYHVAADDRYLYSTLGGTPYILNAYHFETGEQEVVTTFDLPERAVLVRRPEGVFVIVDRQMKSLLYTQPTDDIVRLYHMEHKRLTPVDALPPEPDAVAETQPGVAKPAILESSPVCRGDGSATQWYRPPGDDWKSVTFQAGESPSYMFRLGTFQNKLIGSSEDPYSLFTYDPETKEKSLLGGISLHTYAFQECDGLVYFVGYAGGPVYAWDPKRPWTNQPPNPVVQQPAVDAPEANPRQVALFELQRRSYAIVLAADGRLYVPWARGTQGRMPGVQHHHRVGPREDRRALHGKRGVGWGRGNDLLRNGYRGTDMRVDPPGSGRGPKPDGSIERRKDRVSLRRTHHPDRTARRYPGNHRNRRFAAPRLDPPQRRPLSDPGHRDPPDAGICERITMIALI
jgi:hypothetical protein